MLQAENGDLKEIPATSKTPEFSNFTSRSSVAGSSTTTDKSDQLSSYFVASPTPTQCTSERDITKVIYGNNV